ncbi:MAG: hypothetical protein AAGA22_02720, partial [Pseudomonadota bacterium]
MLNKAAAQIDADNQGDNQGQDGTCRSIVYGASNNPVRKSTFRSALLCLTALTAVSPSVAVADDTSLEDRVSALESKLDKILLKLDERPDALSTNDIRSLSEASKEMKNVAAEAEYQNPRPILVELDTPGGVSAQSTTTPAAAKPAKQGPLSFSSGDFDFTFKGYVKLDTILSEFSDGDLPSSNIGRDFYIPGLIPVGGESNGYDFDFNPRETRFIFAVDGDRDGIDLGALIELDFQVTSDGNERVSNSFTPRMRQAYITIDNWLLG